MEENKIKNIFKHEILFKKGAGKDRTNNLFKYE